MKLEDQVCLLEQAKRLKELGVGQGSLFSWFGDERTQLMDNGVDGIFVAAWLFISTTESCNNQEKDHRQLTGICNPIAAAFTVAELGIMMPDNYQWSWSGTTATGRKWTCAECIVEYEGATAGLMQFGNTEAQARAAMLIDLLETSKITADQVNQQLTTGK